MRVERLELDAYGHYQGTILDLSCPEHGITVLFGPNEAGKSTARRALVAALFGIDRDTPDAHRHGLYGLRIGATLRAADGTELGIVRRGVSGLERADGAPLDEADIDRFRGGVAKLAYGRLFAVDHEELRRGSESLLEADGEIGRLVFGASLGSGSVSAVLARLDERAGTLYRDRGSAQRIPKALKAFQEGMKQARTARVRAREWDRLRQDVELATRRVQKARADFTAAQADQRRVGRLKAAKPLVDRRRRLQRDLEELGPVPSPDWAARAREAAAAYRRARDAYDRATGTRTRLAAEVERIVVPAAVLDRADAIDGLVRGTDRYATDLEHLPKRRAEHEQARQAVHEQLERLGKATDDGAVVAESDLIELERLARQFSALETAERAAVTEVDRAEETVGQLRTRFAALKEPVDIAPLARALDRARAKLDAARMLPAQRAEVRATAAELDGAAARLGLGSLDRSGIESLVVPASTDIEDERARRGHHRFRKETLDAERHRVESDAGALERELEKMATATPDPERVSAARAHRDAGWRRVRAGAEGGAPDLASADGRAVLDAYEEAVARADEAADERYASADAIAKVEQLRAQKSDVEHKLAMLAAQAAELARADAAASAAWDARWSAIGVVAGTPEAMAQWLADERDLVAGIGRWRRDEAKLAAAAGEIDQHQAALRAALDAVGERSTAPELEDLVAHGTAVVQAAHQDAQTRRALEAELTAAEREVPRREAELASRRDALDSWRRSWEVVTRSVGVAASMSTEAALVAVGGHRDLAAARREAGTLARRIAGIERDCRAYEARVAQVAAIFGIDGRTPRRAVAELERELRAAEQAQQRRQTVEEHLAEVDETWHAALGAMDAASRTLDSLRAEAAIACDEDRRLDEGIDDHVERASRAALLRAELKSTENLLVEQGGAEDIDELESDVLGAGDALDGELAALSSTVDALQDELEAANQELAEAKKAFAAVSDAARAADLEQDAQADFALAAASVTEYARTALAATILRRAIAEHGERHRGPLLRRATDLLRLMTDGAYVELATASDGDRQILVVQREGGEHYRVAQLSDGTRDQLYLALRLAGIEHQLRESVEPMPVVLDDVLVHFDDGRAAAAIRALGALGERTQVLLFTHHERVVETVEREAGPTACAVVRLSPRRHEGRAHAGDGSGPKVSSAEARVLAVLRAAGGRSLGKAEVMAMSGVPASTWPAVIRALVRRGSLVQEGERRGARYRLGATELPT